MVAATGSPCRDGRVNLSLRLSAIPEEENKEREVGREQNVRHLPRIPPSPARSYMTVPPSPASFMTVPLTPPPPPSPLSLPPIPPPWDRSCDVGFSTSQRRDIHTEKEAWQRSVSSIYSIFGRAQQQSPAELTLLRLPASIRYRIFRHLVSSPSERPTRMNAQVFTRAVWGPDAFESFAVSLELLQGALNTSFALRAEVLALVFGTRRFHIVFSPYVRPAVCPLATLYLRRYGGLFRNITIELDCTRLGYGMHPAAAGLQPGLLSMGSLVKSFVELFVGVPDREDRNNSPLLDSLIVLCRRYYGNRPSSAAGSTCTTTIETPYVGPEVERVAEQVDRLTGKVASARFVGFSKPFTMEMLETLGGKAIEVRRRSPSDMYPLLPGHSAYVDCGPDLGICLSSHTALSPLICPSSKQSHDDNDDIKTISINDTLLTTSSLSTLSSSSLSSSTSLVSLPSPRLNVPSMAVAHNCPRLAIFPSMASIRRTRRRGPPFLTLFGLFQQRPSSFVGVQLAAAGLAVGAIGSPLRLSGQDVDTETVVGSDVDAVDDKRRDGMGGRMDEKNAMMDSVVKVCLDETVMELCLGQDPSHPQNNRQESVLHRPRRRLQKRRYDAGASFVWSW